MICVLPSILGMLETPPKRKRISAPKISWRTPEQSAMRKDCGGCIAMAGGKLPSLSFLNGLQKKYPVFERRSLQQMKTWISNQRKKKKERKWYTNLTQRYLLIFF